MPSQKTLTRSDIIDTLCKTVKLNRQQATNVLESILGGVGESLANQNVKISSFGTFIVRFKKARIGRNPKTGKEVTIAPRKSLSFRASTKLKELVDRGNR